MQDSDLHSFVTKIEALEAEPLLMQVHLIPKPETLNPLGGHVAHATTAYRPCPDAFLGLLLLCLDWADVSKRLNHLFSTLPTTPFFHRPSAGVSVACN